MNFLKPLKYIILMSQIPDDLKEFIYIILGIEFPIKKRIWFRGKSDSLFWSNTLSDNWSREIFSASLTQKELHVKTNLENPKEDERNFLIIRSINKRVVLTHNPIFMLIFISLQETGISGTAASPIPGRSTITQRAKEAPWLSHETSKPC